MQVWAVIVAMILPYGGVRPANAACSRSCCALSAPRPTPMAAVKAPEQKGLPPTT